VGWGWGDAGCISYVGVGTRRKGGTQSGRALFRVKKPESFFKLNLTLSSGSCGAELKHSVKNDILSFYYY
jgi:hypothetical protein